MEEMTETKRLTEAEARLSALENDYKFLRSVVHAVAIKAGIAVVKHVLSDKPDEIMVMKASKVND